MAKDPKRRRAGLQAAATIYQKYGFDWYRKIGSEGGKKGGRVRAHWKDNRCKYGHEMTPDNIYERTVNGKPYRTCKACLKRRTAAYRERLKMYAEVSNA